jgi:hypothetical protein
VYDVLTLERDVPQNHPHWDLAAAVARHELLLLLLLRLEYASSLFDR